MARPREFCETSALDRAMEIFWRKGYAGTSISDLVEATGLGRQSLYNTFGDKDDLFEKALAHYRLVAGRVLEPLLRADAGLADVRKYVLANLELQKERQCGVCLMVRTASDRQIPDDAVRELARKTTLQSRAIFSELIRKLQERGEVTSRLEPERIADYLFSVVNGLSLLASTGASEEEVLATLDFSLEPLRPIAGAP